MSARTTVRAIAPIVVLLVALVGPAGAAVADGGDSEWADPEPLSPPVGLLPVPDPLPPGPPGSLVASAPFPVDAFPFAVEGHQLLYRSTDRFGAAIPVSGALLVPTGVAVPAGGRPVVAVPHGTVGITDGCAPSMEMQLWGQPAYEDVTALLAGGAIVVATDYPGMGTPGVHPYLDGISEGRAVLDSIRAARDFGGTGPAAVTGLSQGGHASIFAGAEWTTYAPDVDLRAVVPVAAPTFTSAAYAARDLLPNASAYVGIIINGIVAARPDLDRSQLLTEGGLEAFARLEAHDATPGSWCSYGEIDVEADVRADPVTLPAWRDALVENEPGARSIAAPVLMVASEGDTTSPPYMTEAICAALTGLGTDLRLWMYDDETHVGVSYASADDRATWILARLAGEPPTRAVDWIGEEPAVRDGCPLADVDDPEDPADPVDPDDVDDADAEPPPAPPATPVAAPARLAG